MEWLELITLSLATVSKIKRWQGEKVRAIVTHYNKRARLMERDLLELN